MYDHEDQRWKTCPICGEGFLLAPEHALTDYCGNYVCTPHCNNVAYQRKYGDKKPNPKQEKPKQAKKVTYSKPVLVIKKEDGETMNRYHSVKEAAEATGFSATKVSQVCRGEATTIGAYTFKFENEQPVQKNVIWKRKPAQKAVLQFNLLEEFIARYDSVNEAAKATGCKPSCISGCCRGRQYTTRGFIFKFAE